jgi:tRNA nucleotidyltransferase (CCA-adding enzyme)
MLSREEVSVTTLVLREGEQAPADSKHAVTIHLTLQEESLFTTLLQAVEYLEQGKLPDSEPHKVELRIAGGWVRDRVLGVASHDVDIAIGGMSGVDFATAVQSYLKLKQPDQVKRIGVIAANPNQSKHLETATMVVMGLECDFCNLRAQEIYTEDSRIPVTRFGTELEDAQRRDFCLNALFYNLHTKQVEDWTQRGLKDLLEEKLLVTPLDPFITLQDDPLRVLRAIRFAIRLDFTLDETLRQASSSDTIHQALMVKVSRERVGKELEGMLSGKGAKPHKALALIGDLQLSSCVFSLPPSVDVRVKGDLMDQSFAPERVTEAWNMSQSLMPHVATIQSTLQSHPKVQTVLNSRLFALASYLLPFRKLHYLDKKSKEVSVVDFMVRESIKFKNTDVSRIMTLMDNVDTFATLIEKCGDGCSRLDVGMLLRRTKELWVTCLFLASVLQQQHQPSTMSAQQLHNTIAEMDLDLSWKTRPLLDGRALIKALDLPKGPMIGTYLEEQVKWMLRHPLGTKEQCLEHLVLFKKQLETTKRHLEPIDNEESKRAHVEKH